jgi:hypothetical protein
MAEPITVKPRQIWQDCDPRSAGRYLLVEEVGPTHAVVLQVDRRGEVVGKERRTRIRLDRFRPTSNGYRLIKDTEETS